MAVRLADLLAGLSRLADLGFGLPTGESMRSAALAMLLARSLELGEDDVHASMYAALLLHVGCVGFAHETVHRFGDEFALNVAAERTDLADAQDRARTLLPAVTAGRPLLTRGRLTVALAARGRRFGHAYDTASCEVGRDAARRLRLADEVQRGVYHASEWWNGGGAPHGLAGDDIPIAARIAALTGPAALLDTVAGGDAAADGIGRRAGGMLDPQLTEHFAGRARDLLGELAATDAYRLVLDGEPTPVVSVLDPHLVDVATVFGDLADLKTPAMHGHSRGVASLARAAGARSGLAPADVDLLEIAGHLHDVGRVAVSDLVWEKPGPLTASEWEQVRLHPYHSERILSGSRRLAPLARVVGSHHERCDGSGYHRGSGDHELDLLAKVLAAADAYQAMTGRRPYRRALPPDRAATELRDDARRGRLDPDAVGAVLAVAGHPVARIRREPPAGLTDREVEVLVLVAEGCSNQQIADRLVVSRRTAEYHVQRIYAKIGTSSRASAAMFAMEHRLLATEDP